MVLRPLPSDFPRVVHARLAGLLPQGIRHPIFSNCSPTCHVRLIVPLSTPSSTSCDQEYWELETLDCDNRTKTVGGDEFYVTYNDNNDNTAKPVVAVAWWKDLHNGRYQLDFQATPMSSQQSSSYSSSSTSSSESTRNRQGGAVLTVYFQYTCGIGQMAHPLKKDWAHGGQTVGVAKFTMTAKVPPPPIRPFEVPSNNNNQERPNLSNFSTIIPMGDSLLQYFLKPLGIGLPNMNSALNSTTWQKWKQYIDSKLKFNKDYSKTVVIAGSCAWDILEYQKANTTTMTSWTNNDPDNKNNNPPEWENHRIALTHLLTHILETYPQITVFWKSCAAFHIHVPQLYRSHQPNVRAFMEQRLKYMSTSRAESLHRVQTNVVTQLQKAHPRHRIFFIDVHPAYYLSADLARPGDGRHFIDRLDVRISNWFTNETTVERLWRERHSNETEEPILLLVDDDNNNNNVHNGSWIEWVNAALLAKVTRRNLVWEQRGMTTTTTTGGSSFLATTSPRKTPDGPLVITQQQLYDRTTFLSKEKRISMDPSTEKFVTSLFNISTGSSTSSAPGGSKYLLYGMIFHSILVELSIKNPSNVAAPSFSEEGGTTIMIAPFSDPPPSSFNLEQYLDKSLSQALPQSSAHTPTGTETTANGRGCEILVPSHDWSLLIDDTLKGQHNCTIRIQSFDQPSETLTIATHLAESWSKFGSSRIILNCSMPSSLLFWHLVNHRMQARARRLGILPFDEVFSHCCL